MDTTKLKSRLGTKLQTLQEPTTVPAEMQASLIPANSSYVALSSNALDIVKENLKSQPLSVQLFDVVKAPSGGKSRLFGAGIVW